jgi:hypothetical protein
MYIIGTIGYRHDMMAVNSTRDFHTKGSIDLMREYTINESLSSLDSHYMACIEEPRPFGQIVAGKLISQGLLFNGSTILEAGGGYGTLMASLLDSSCKMVKKVVMADLSRGLLLKQKKRLEPWAAKCSFVNADIHEMLCTVKGIDLLIMNEVIGDLDTMTGLEPSNLPMPARTVIERYGLDMPESGPFCLNTGAINAVEAICENDFSAFLSEHSSDPIIPHDMPWLAKGLELDSYPREIKLFGHSEYTIRFTHLIKVAHALGRKTLTGSYIDLTGLKRKPSYRFIFEAGACSTPEQEIILEFLDHIREYRWLIIF